MHFFEPSRPAGGVPLPFQRSEAMSDRASAGCDPAPKQPDFPPGIDAPSPPGVRARIVAGGEMPPDVERDLRRLADRVGGWDRLRGLVDRLAGRA
jgi:hypothetical protein